MLYMTHYKISKNEKIIERGEKMIRGKHSEVQQEINRLNKIIARKDRELQETKMSLADVFKKIEELNTCNTAGEPATRRKITEIAHDTHYALMKDIYIENDTDKIIKLSSTRKSTR